MTILKAEEGKKFIRADKSAVYDTIIYLSDIDSKDNYIQVSDEEAVQLQASLDLKAQEGLKSAE